MKRRSGYQLMRAKDPRSVNDREDWEQLRLIAFHQVVGVWPSVARLPDPEEWERGQPKPESWELLDEIDRTALRMVCRTDREKVIETVLEYVMREDTQLHGIDWTEDYSRIVEIVPKIFRPAIAKAYDEGKPLPRTTAGIIARALFDKILTDELPSPKWAKAVLSAMLI